MNTRLRLRVALVLALSPCGLGAQPVDLVPAPAASVPAAEKDLDMGASVQQILQQDPDAKCSAMRRELDEMGFVPQRRAALWERYQAECRRESPLPTAP